MSDTTAVFSAAREAVINVGRGRGFVVRDRRNREPIVITAAHCLPKLPPVDWDTEELTYVSLLGPLNAEPSVSARCLFVDLITDLAVLGSTDDEQQDAYLDWLRPIRPLGVARRATARVFMLSLKGRWKEVTPVGDPGGWVGVKDKIERGMSGSPILDDEGRALGVISRGYGYPDPALHLDLPRWFFSGPKCKPPEVNLPRFSPKQIDRILGRKPS